MLEFNFSPFPAIETDRLLLRPMEHADFDQLYALRNNADAMLYLNKGPQTADVVKQMIGQIRAGYERNDAITWAIALKNEPGNLIGTIGFWQIDKTHHRAEIGYMLHPGHWRKGLLSEAMEKAMHYGFEIMKLHSVEAHINPDNTASINLVKKHGYEQEAYFRENYRFEGQFLDTVVYCKVNS